ncbi:alpha/beta hydrolase [Lysinibacillus sp. SGAir0095]|uniref:alpha/beta hydrolase n=1 Tax=Lysinibacillus sp. SGAir0095 TaxID=2070463 RepID=UPI0010CD11CC|nr:alpha/beta hydrolase [Lysinibacillus sp. SGAir0095]QCR34088.1 alpha/beta hydrolase [Lysinibacillus sp. SGAir0095]
MLNISKVIISFMLFFSLGSTSTVLIRAQDHGVSSGETKQSNVDITITGEADEQLLDQLTNNLKAESEEEIDPDESIRGSAQYIDMDQFKKRYLNIPYTDTQNDRQQLDIVYPPIGNPPYKVIVALHGGGWSNGDRKSASIKTIQMAAQQGYVVINAGYRLTDEAKWPAQLHDVKAAIRFIRANAKEYRLDTRNIVVWGNSAGGHLASMLGATNGMVEMEDLSMGNSKASSEVQGVVSWYGISDISTLPDTSINIANKLLGFNVREKAEEAGVASPNQYVTKEYPPIFMIHGTNDRIVPFKQAVEFAKKINQVTGKKQASIKLHINATHGDNAIKNVTNVDETLNFIDKIMYTERKNPYRTKKYNEIKTTSEKSS